VRRRYTGPNRSRVKDKLIGATAIASTGGNIDARLLASLLMRGLVRSGRLVRLRAELPDLPGVLSQVSGVIGGLGGNIVEVHHQRLFHDTSVKRAELDVVVETQNRRHVDTIIDAVDLKAASDGEARGATHCDLVTELQRHGAARGQRMSAGEQDCSAAIAASIKHGTNPIDG